jgi:hypothetical protein
MPRTQLTNFKHQRIRDSRIAALVQDRYMEVSKLRGHAARVHRCSSVTSDRRWALLRHLAQRPSSDPRNGLVCDRGACALERARLEQRTPWLSNGLQIKAERCKAKRRWRLLPHVRLNSAPTRISATKDHTPLHINHLTALSSAHLQPFRLQS